MKYVPYSHSKILKGHCPFAFHKTYIEKAPRVRQENLEFGSAVHNVIKDVLEFDLKGHSYNIVELINRNTPHSISHRIDEIIAIMKTFKEKFRVKGEDVVGIEEKVALDFEGKASDWDNSYLRGVIDVLEINEDHATITDHKTQFNILTDEEMKKNGQLSFYSLLTKAFYPQVERFTVQMYFARYGVTKRSTRTMDDVVRYSDVVEAKINSIENIEEWVPIPGQTCGICEHIHLCPLAKYDQDNRDNIAVINEASAIRAAKLLRVREVQVKNLKDALRAYTATHGPVRVSDTWSYGHVQRETSEWPTHRTHEVFAKHGYSTSFCDHIMFSKSSMEGLIKRAQRLEEEFAEDLEKVKTTKTSTTFKGYGT